jgi:hypothetical protein
MLRPTCSCSTISSTRSFALLHMRLLHQHQSPLCVSRAARRPAPLRKFSSASCPVAVRHATQSRGQSRNLFPGRSTKLTPTSPEISSTTTISNTRYFSSTRAEMTATKIDGTAIAKTIRERLHSEIEATQKVNPRFKPCLRIIQGMSYTATASSKANISINSGR